jgi:hypothetical protein
MKKIIFLSLVIILLMGTTGVVFAKNNDPNKKPDTGFDEYGYNYSSSMFNGRYCDSDHELGGDYCNYQLLMKWSPGWFDTVDSFAAVLDPGYTNCRGGNNYLPPSECPGSWVTNHMRGEYLNAKGETCTYVSFSKMVSVPVDAYLEDGVWYTADGEEIGRAMGEDGYLALIQKVVNDPCRESQGLFETYPSPSGFGVWK